MNEELQEVGSEKKGLKSGRVITVIKCGGCPFHRDEVDDEAERWWCGIEPVNEEGKVADELEFEELESENLLHLPATNDTIPMFCPLTIEIEVDVEYEDADLIY
jgi:hypothetical protein